MFTADIGWAFERAFGHTLRTNDGGAHWQDITPREAQPNSLEAVSFLDQEHAWLVIPPPSNQNQPITATVWSTSDGGLTWIRGGDFSYSGDNLGGILTFLDVQHGWFLANLGGGAGTWYSELFRTTDGGMHWTEVMLNSATPAAAASPGSFPPCAIAGLTFLDSGHGWAAGDCLTPEPTLFASQDGGRTWRTQKLPLPADIPQGAAPSPWPPVFVSSRAGVVLVGGVPGPHSVIAYISNDGGQTWQPHEVGTGSIDPVGPPDFVDARTGWFVGRSTTSGDQELLVTHDGGRTWAVIQSNAAPGDIDFIDAQVGWTLTPDDLLMRTRDGGMTWTAMNPQLATP